jgi:hexosaminidase
VPLPLTAVSSKGSLSVDHGLQVVFEGYTELRLYRARLRFLGILSRETGIPNVRIPPLKRSVLVIRTTSPSAPVQQLGEDESYHLEITSSGALLRAPNPLGVLHELQTFSSTDSQYH